MKSFCLLPALALLVGCQAFGNDPYHNGDAPRINDDLLVHVPADDRDDIEEARRESLKLKDAVAKAEHDVDVEQERLSIARDESDVAEDEVDNARRRLDLARRGDREGDVKDADERLADARKRYRASRAKVEWHKVKIDQLQADVTTARLRVELAEAKLELAKARAVHDLDRPETRDVAVHDFEACVEDHETRVKMAEVDADAWKKKLDLSEERMKAREDD